jgi:5'(3')-deoxyribonucleotidase
MAGRIFVDLDGVIVDFARFAKETGLAGEQIKKMRGAYLAMQPIPGAIEAVKSLIGMGYDVWVASKPPTGIAFAYADKAQWVFEHLPELKRKIILTHDKGLLGDEGDWLIDDRITKAACQHFPGGIFDFRAEGGNLEKFGWPEILGYFRNRKAAREAVLPESGL